MSTESTLPNVPQMHAESGFDETDSAAPLRVSGFVCLLLGILSFAACFGQPLLVIPLAAVLFGLIALRRSGEQRPVGTTPAMIGMVLAVGFGACGLFLPWFKTVTLGSQAAQFGRYYIEVVARGEDHIAMELQKDYVNRFPPTMNLKEHYAISESGQRAWEEFKDQSINQTIQMRGPDAEWVLDRAVRVYYSYGREHAEVVWADPTGETTAKIRMFLEYRIDSKGNGQWHVERCMVFSPKYVAPQVL